MSPDIEWQITDESDPQTVVKTTEPKPPRWRVLAVLAVVVLGIGLGFVYRSIPEPAAQPLQSPTPTAEPDPELTGLPPALFRLVDREAQALADGDSSIFTNESASADTPLYRFQRGGFRPWGRPPDGSMLYQILDFSLQTPDNAWVDVRQYRNGHYFRETRFYRQSTSDWARSEPDLQLWSGTTESSDSLHFHVIYPIEDRSSIMPIIQQVEKDYSQLCQDLACAAVVPCPASQTLTRCSPIQHELTFTLVFSPEVSQNFFQFPLNANELRLPSPRIMGVFEQGNPIGPENSFYLGGLAQLMAQRIAYGNAEASSPSRDGRVILRAIAQWASSRAGLTPYGNRFGTFNFTADPQQLLPLEALWNHADNSNGRLKSREAFAVVRFIEQTYGPPSVTKLLGALGQARSFSEAIETGLDVHAASFQQKWEDWLKKPQA